MLLTSSCELSFRESEMLAHRAAVKLDNFSFTVEKAMRITATT